uniref:Uncharacterized protein n=1 Tax=Anguilla anguilla TaxID=7936 RepID=A0A0E9W9D8_ANGAN
MAFWCTTVLSEWGVPAAVSFITLKTVACPCTACKPSCFRATANKAIAVLCGYAVRCPGPRVSI